MQQAFFQGVESLLFLFLSPDFPVVPAAPGGQLQAALQHQGQLHELPLHRQEVGRPDPDSQRRRHQEGMGLLRVLPPAPHRQGPLQLGNVMLMLDGHWRDKFRDN